MTLEGDLLERVTYWADEARAATTARNEAIVTALAAGASARAVGRLAGLSHVAVGKIAARRQAQVDLAARLAARRARAGAV